jgi:predicted NAD/FAD-binding protein
VAGEEVLQRRARIQRLGQRQFCQPVEADDLVSVHNPASGLEYNGHSLTSLFAQRRNLLKPAFWGPSSLSRPIKRG